jgi:hypothetical protein
VLIYYHKSACLSFNERIFLILFSGDVQKILLGLAEEVECTLKQQVHVNYFLKPGTKERLDVDCVRR